MYAPPIAPPTGPLLHVYRYLKSTAGNIQLINQFRRRNYNNSLKSDEREFGFWMEFFIEATRDNSSLSQLPVSHMTS